MDPFIGEIRPFAFPYAPAGWAFCNGQQLLISQNQDLYSIIGTTYGGDGVTNFNVPNIQGQVLVGSGILQPPGATYVIGKAGGAETVKLNPAETAPHNHNFIGATAGGLANALQNETTVPQQDNSFLSNIYTKNPATNTAIAGQMYVQSPGSVAMNSNTLSLDGNAGPLAHENRSPYLVINYCIALQGDLPIKSDRVTVK